MSSGLVRSARRWSDAVFREPRGQAGARLFVGVLPGEGIGPEVISAALGVLAALESPGGPVYSPGKERLENGCRIPPIELVPGVTEPKALSLDRSPSASGRIR